MPILSSHLSKFCPFSVQFLPDAVHVYGVSAGVGEGVGVIVGRTAGM